MKSLAIDIETYSAAKLAECGVYRYAEDPSFAILLFAYSVDGGAVQCVDVARGEKIPAEVLAALSDEHIEKTAYNAQFERVCLSKFLGMPVGKYLNPRGWRCTKVRAARAGFPLPLGRATEVLGAARKMEEGKALIRYFSCPAPNGERRYPEADLDRWGIFKAYCIRDVEAEQAVLAKVRCFEETEAEQELYIADQEINDRGVLCDRRLVDAAVRASSELKQGYYDEMRRLTGLENPNSVASLKEWLAERTRQSVDTLRRADLDVLAEKLRFYPDARRVLQLRKEAGKTSTAKYEAMSACACADGRIRGLLQFYGARTGRWAGRLVQLQNLPQNHLPDLPEARAAVLSADAEELQMLFKDPMQTLSELVRSALIPAEGCTFHVCDYAAIEARVLAWLFNEEWVLEAFRAGHDIYCETAARMYGVPVEKHGRNAHLRAKGKIAVLALGYGGGTTALRAMGAEKAGLTESEMRAVVDMWRKSNANIVRGWKTIERACLTAIEQGREVELPRGIVMRRERGALTIQLPSRRKLVYPRAEVQAEEGQYGAKPSVTFEGPDTLSGKWTRLRTYGGRLVENIVQATARDVLAEALLKIRAKGMRCVFHVHDEVVVEAPAGQNLDALLEIFATPPQWAHGLPLKGAAFSTPYYIKD